MKIALGIEYDGSPYYGWQKQARVPSVQDQLETVLSRIADEPIQLFCAGRTDAGVHASGQVVHFETSADRDNRAWTLGANAQLPKTIAVRWVQTVDDSFHARFSAMARRYRYLIYNHRLRPALFNTGLLTIPQPLDAAKMHRAAQSLLGEQDFSAFRAAQCQSKTPWRHLHRIRILRQGEYVIMDIQANAFLHHMVRNIMGSLIEIGKGVQNEHWLAELLATKDRTLAAATVKPNGLYLTDVLYPDKYQLPKGAAAVFLSSWQDDNESQFFL